MGDRHMIEDFIRILQNCRKRKDLECAKHVHAQIRRNRMESHPVLGNYIVPMFVECGSMLDAEEVFNKLAYRNVFSWTYLILGYIHSEKPHHALKLYDDMKEEGAQPSSYTLVALLKACARLEDIEKGREIHNETIQKGFETNLLVGNTITNMYAKSGCPFEAQKAFDKLLERDIVLWNVLVSGYVDHGLDHEALKCFERMRLEGTSPNATTFVCLLKACGNMRDILIGQNLHAYIVQKGFEIDSFLGNTLVDIYGKCGLLSEARQIFDKLSVRNVVSWSALIDGCAEHQGDHDTLELYKMMKLEGVFPNVVTLTSILKACANLSALDKGQETHSEITQRGHDEEYLIGNSLMDMYVKCGALSEARKIFDKLHSRNLVSWNTIIGGLAEYEQGKEAVNLLEEMQGEGISPDIVTYICVLKACNGVKEVDKIRGLHTEIIGKGLEVGSLIGSTLLDRYAKCGLLVEAQEVFEKLLDQNVVAWNTLLAGYAEHGVGQECLDCFAKMQAKNVYANVVTCVCILKEYGSIQLLEKGQQLHKAIVQQGFDVDSYVGNTLVDMYARCGSLLDARVVFENLSLQDIVSWNALIAGYTEHGPRHEALSCFECMQKRGFCEDGLTLVSVLKACGNIGAVESVKDIHMKILYKGYEKDVFLCGTLIVVYAKCGSLAEAKDVFDKMEDRSVVLWNAMITGYGMNHEAHMAVKIFETMIEKGVKPDEITFLCLFTACSRASLVDNGQEFLKAMTEDYSILKTSDHFASIVDLLARSGHLNEAEKFLETIPCIPSKDTWTALLNACKNHIQAGAGTRCFQQLVHIKPDCASCYVLVSKLYASQGVDASAGSNDQSRERVAIQGSSCSRAEGIEYVPDVEASLDIHEYHKTSTTNTSACKFLEPLTGSILQHLPLRHTYPVEEELVLTSVASLLQHPSGLIPLLSSLSTLVLPHSTPCAAPLSSPCSDLSLQSYNRLSHYVP